MDVDALSKRKSKGKGKKGSSGKGKGSKGQNHKSNVRCWNCVEVEKVASALTPVVSGVAQAFHDLLVELRLLLVAEVEEGEKEDRQEESWEVESGVGRVEEKQPLACMAWRWSERCKTQSWAMNVSVIDDQGL